MLTVREVKLLKKSAGGQEIQQVLELTPAAFAWAESQLPDADLLGKIGGLARSDHLSSIVVAAALKKSIPNITPARILKWIDEGSVALLDLRRAASDCVIAYLVATGQIKESDLNPGEDQAPATPTGAALPTSQPGTPSV